MAYGYVTNEDPEVQRSFARQAYGHEIWLGDVFREDDEICVYGLYGHKMVPDKPMPSDYAQPVLYGDEGRLKNPYREIVKDPHGWKFCFEDVGADVYTLYVDSNSTWVTDESGWHSGVKRDFSETKYSGAFNMVAKRIISKDGVDPGSVIHATLEIMPEKAKLSVGQDAVMRILYEGEPLPDHKVLCYCEGRDAVEFFKTDSEGVLRYPIGCKGTYIFIAKYTDEDKKVDEEFDETAFTTTLTMETD
ncbi:MAG: DUF4198 domain-containing protein [Candidatus Methanomethylophilaceae archaeon]|nr:DUF4198 domain-containing protein [Candidatus Methanomethylophilaceae archaeon]